LQFDTPETFWHKYFDLDGIFGWPLLLLVILITAAVYETSSAATIRVVSGALASGLITMLGLLLASLLFLKDFFSGRSLWVQFDTLNEGLKELVAEAESAKKVYLDYSAPLAKKLDLEKEIANLDALSRVRLDVYSAIASTVQLSELLDVLFHQLDLEPVFRPLREEGVIDSSTEKAVVGQLEEFRKTIDSWQAKLMPLRFSVRTSRIVKAVLAGTFLSFLSILLVIFSTLGDSLLFDSIFVFLLTASVTRMAWLIWEISNF
jgi:hypothetical protein